MKIKLKSKNGFTLIEVMLSLFITAIVIAILSIVFNTGLRAFRQGRDILDITKRAQLAMGVITRELSNAMVFQNAPLQGAWSEDKGYSIYFMAPVDNTSNYELCEVGYYLNTAGQLIKYFLTKTSNSFSFPNSVVYNPAIGGTDTLCDNVIAFELHYFNGTTWSSTWTTADKLPQLVEVKLEIQGKYPTNAPAQKEEFVTRVCLPNSTNNP